MCSGIQEYSICGNNREVLESSVDGALAFRVFEEICQLQAVRYFHCLVLQLQKGWDAYTDYAKSCVKLTYIEYFEDKFSSA